MSRRTQSDQDQLRYRTYDNRVVSRETIDRAVRMLEARQRRREQWEHMRTWILLTLISMVIVAASIVLIWRLSVVI